MFNVLTNVFNTTYLKWLFIFLFVVAILHIAYGLHEYLKGDKAKHLYNSALFLLLIFLACYGVGWALEVDKINANIRYEFITEDGQTHEGNKCYFSGGLFSTDGVYCKDYDGFTYTNVISYNRIVEVSDEN